MDARLMVEAFEVVHEASEVPDSERDILIERRCDGRPALRDAVERIVAAPDEGEFDARLDEAIQGLLPQMTDAEKDPLLNTVIGSYRVIEFLAEGGMGRVYRAVHQGHGGVVAFKVVRSRHGRSEERIGRLQREANLLARCHHAGIVQIHHVGTLPDGGIYFTMELVEGLPLLDYCKAEGMGFEARLQVFLKVCEAVEAAHRVRVIHRDLKPSNILASKTGVKLLDFGVAEVFGDGATDSRGYVSVPYAAPEHLDETTTLTDVYSLGVVLGELVLNRLPSTIREGMTAERSVLKDMADTTLAPWLHEVGRLQWQEIESIYGQATRTDPAGRYGSVREMALDVRQLLEGRPVQALREREGMWPRLYAGWLLLRRNRVATSGAAAVLLLCGVSLTFYVHDLKTSRALARKERDTAEQRRKQQVWMERELWNGDGSINSQAMTRTLLDQRIHRAETVEIDADQRAALYETSADEFVTIEDFPRAQALFDQALELAKHLHGAESPEVADVLVQEANLTYTLGNAQGGVDLARRAKLMLLTTMPKTALPVLKAEVEEAECLTGLGNYERARSLLGDAVLHEKNDAGAQEEYSTALNDLSIVEGYLGRYPESIALQEQSMAIDRVDEGSRHPDIGEHLISISNGYMLMRDPGRAIRAAREAVDILSGSLPANHHEVLAAERQLASSLTQGEKYDEADALMKKVLSGLDQEGRSTQTNAVALYEYGLLQRKMGRMDEAMRYNQLAFTLFKRLFPKPNPFWADASLEEALVLYLKGELKEAEAKARGALALRRELYGQTDARTLVAKVLLARILIKEKRAGEAVPLLMECKADATGTGDATQQVLGDVRELLATVKGEGSGGKAPKP